MVAKPVETFLWFFMLGAVTYVSYRTVTVIKDQIMISIDTDVTDV